MTPTEDDYTDETTSAKEYEPGTCCISSVKILEEGCRSVVGSKVSKWPKSRIANHSFFPCCGYVLSIPTYYGEFQGLCVCVCVCV